VTGTVLSGRAVADSLLEAISERVSYVRGESTPPHLAFVTIGDSPPAQVYVHRLERLATRVGAEVSQHHLSGNVTLLELERAVGRLNADPAVDGILVQMPLPDHLIPADLSGLIDLRKDVDGVTVCNVGQLYLGLPGQRPPTALAMMEMLSAAGVSATGRHAVVVGRSNVVGHPVTELLLQVDATVTVTHRQTADLGSHIRQAEILMVGAGEPRLITRDMISPGVVVIDAGINVTASGVVGDVAFEECAEVAAAITPVPGGVGPVTNAILLRNLVDSAEQRLG
jgi:methylenetetrahydrofolate dehydrogenase (NADP+)/methenyltetrahydrofolate cyclohydrolase